MQLTVSVGDLLHETQKERGATSVYMSSAGEKFQLELLEQQALTDTRRAALSRFLDDRLADLPGVVDAGLVPALDALDQQLDSVRSGALALSADTRDTIDYFTDMNQKFLDAIALIGSSSTNADLSQGSAAYLAFLQGKEKAGVERAQLANVFGEDRFAPGQFVTVVSL